MGGLWLINPDMHSEKSGLQFFPSPLTHDGIPFWHSFPVTCPSGEWTNWFCKYSPQTHRSSCLLLLTQSGNPHACVFLLLWEPFCSSSWLLLEAALHPSPQSVFTRLAVGSHPWGTISLLLSEFLPWGIFLCTHDSSLLFHCQRKPGTVQDWMRKKTIMLL